MSFFGMGSKTERYGVIIDIGSGSVLSAIVHSNATQKHPQIIWSHREHTPIRNIDSIEQSAKAVITALVNVSMQLDSVGRKALYDYDSKAKLTSVQSTISAPWSYTITKRIQYNQEKDFVITEDLIEELTVAVQEKITNDVKENDALLNLGLSVVTRGLKSLVANGYSTANPVGNTAKTLSLSLTSVIAQQYLIDVIEEMRDKLFAHADSQKLSFMLVMYTIARDLFGRLQDTCLVDVTYEATEIGVVRDEVLTYCTHTPFGLFSLAREISAITGATLHESFGYLHTDTPYAFVDTLPKSQKEEVEAIFESYIEKLVLLFHETGDSLSIPKQISINTDFRTESTMADLIERAVKRTIKVSPNIIFISEDVAKHIKNEENNAEARDNSPNDAALLLAAEFFHTKLEHESFKYL